MNIEEVRQLAESLATKAQEMPGAVVFALHGELGVGKTTFSQFFAQALGVSESVISPTFVLMKRYALSSSGSKKNLYHVDAYRFDDPSEVDTLDLADIFLDPDNIVLLEWPERIGHHLPANATHIYFEYKDEKNRTVTIK